MKEYQDAIYLVVFLVLVFGVPLSVVRATYSENSRIDLRALWIFNNRIDPFRVIILGTWWPHTCAMILETLLRTVETQDWTTYQLWAIPIIAKMFAPSGQSSTESETTTTTTSSSTTNPEKGIT